MFIGSWRTFASTGMSCFWTLNSAKHSLSSTFSRSNLAYELYGKSGFLERQLSHMHKTKNSSSEIILLSYASNSISLVSRKDIFTGFFQAFEAGFEWVAVAKILLCLSLDFGGNGGALLPRLARLKTSPSPEKRLAPVVRKVDNAIHRINHYPADSVVCFVNTYQLVSDLSAG